MSTRIKYIVLATMMMLSLHVQALTDYVWNGLGADNNWTTDANWTNNASYPSTASDRAIFTGTTRPSLVLNGVKTVGELIITNTTVAWTIAGSTLTLPHGGKLINFANNWPNGGTWTISSPINLLGDAYISFALQDGNPRTFLISSNITGSSTLYLEGNNTSKVKLSGNNTNFTGTVICTGGTVEMGHANCFGLNSTNVHLLNNSTVNLTGLYTGLLNVYVKATMGIVGNGTFLGNVCVISNSALLSFSTGGNSPTLSGAFTGPGSINRANNVGGTITLGGATTNTLSGTFTNAGATLALGKTGNATAIAGPLVIVNSIVRHDTSNQISDTAPVTVLTNGILRLNGQNDTIGALYGMPVIGVVNAAIVENNHATSVSTLTISNNIDSTYQGVLRDGATAKLNMVKDGSAVFYMSGQANNTGGLVIKGGALSGTGTISSAVSVLSGGTLTAGGTSGAAGTLTVNNNLTNAVGATLSFDLSAPNTVGSGVNDLITGIVDLSLSGSVNVNGLSGFTTGHKGDKWRLINYTGYLSGGGLAIGSVPSTTYTLGIDTATPGQVNLLILSNAVTPGTPSAPSPADTATSVAESTTLDWADALDADGYQVFFWKSTDSEPGTPTALVTTSQYTPPTLDLNTTYNWKIVATNSAFASIGATWSFTTRSNPTPIIPTAPSPTNSTTEVLVSTVLSWSSFGADAYEVYLWKTSESQPGTPTAVVSSSSYNPGGLDYATTYNWQVIATNMYGSSTGLVWTFTTRNHRPFPPNTPSPANGASNISPATSLNWTCTDADSYQVYVWLSSGTKPGTPTAEVASPTYTPTSELIDFTNYTWQVVAVNTFGTESGPVWTFGTERTVTGLNFVWNGVGPNDKWDTLANWVGAFDYPRLVNDTAIFTGNIQPAVQLNGDRTVGQLVITNTTVGWTIAGSKLTLAPGGKILNFVDNWPNGGTWTISSALNLLGDADIRFLRSDGNGRTFSISGQITGSNTLYLAGMRTSIVSISGDNKGFLGNIVCVTGLVSIAHANAFGTNTTPAEIRGGVTLQQSSVNKPLRALGDFTMEYSFTYGGTIELVNNATFTIATGGGNNCNVNGAISGTGNVKIEKNGGLGGTVANTYTGLTTVVGTGIRLNKTPGLDAVTGPLTIGGGSAVGQVVLQGTNQINDASDVNILVSGSNLDLANFNETINRLSLATGTFVQTGTGTGGRLTVTKLTVGTTAYPGGLYTAENAPSFVQGTGSIKVLLRGTAICFK